MSLRLAVGAPSALFSLTLSVLDGPRPTSPADPAPQKTHTQTTTPLPTQQQSTCPPPPPKKTRSTTNNPTQKTTIRRCFREETFGPLIPIFRFSTEDEAVALANDTEYGLAAYFYTRDLARAWKIAERLEYGMVGLNEIVIGSEVAPFGGVKQSGYGVENSARISGGGGRESEGGGVFSFFLVEASRSRANKISSSCRCKAQTWNGFGNGLR